MTTCRLGGRKDRLTPTTAVTETCQSCPPEYSSSLIPSISLSLFLSFFILKISPRLVYLSISNLPSLSEMIIFIFPKSPFFYLSLSFLYHLNTPPPPSFYFFSKFHSSLPSHLLSTFRIFPKMTNYSLRSTCSHSLCSVWSDPLVPI